MMSVEDAIENYLDNQSEPKRGEMRELHRRILQIAPDCRLWFEDGKDADGKIVSNPNIGYGLYTIRYADGKTRDFFQVGLSGNTTGISIYIMGIADKTYLPKTFGETIGKAKVTGYCIKFKALKAIDVAVLDTAIRFGLQPRS